MINQIIELFNTLMILPLFFYVLGKLTEYIDRRERYKDLMNKKAIRRKYRTLEQIKRVETEYHISEFKKNPQLWRDLLEEFGGTPPYYRLLERYTFKKDGKVYWRY